MPRPPIKDIRMKCGDPDLFTRETLLCDRCKKLSPEQRPKECKNEVVIDLGKKY